MALNFRWSKAKTSLIVFNDLNFFELLHLDKLYLLGELPQVSTVYPPKIW